MNSKINLTTKGTILIAFVGLLMLIPSIISAQNITIIDSKLNQFEGEKECLINFEAANLSSTRGISEKSRKGLLTYQLLRNQVEKQRKVQHFLSSKNKAFKSYWIVNCVAVKLNEAEVDEIARFDDVLSIQYNSAIYKSQPIETTPIILREPTYTWGIQMIQADIVQEMGYQGQGVVVGGQDTGVKWDVSSIKSSYRGNGMSTVDHNYNWYDAIHKISPIHMDSIVKPGNNPCGLNSIIPCDDSNHGTHTVGTMVGQEGEDVIGVAPEAQWIACRCMERGWGSVQTYLECFQFFLAPTDVDGNNPRPEMAPHVINNSWGCPPIEGCDTSNFIILQEAVENLRSAGVVVVASAGNDGRRGCSSISSPAAMFDAAFVVGATASNDSIARFSSKGPVIIDGSGRIKPNVSAPGVGVRSQIRNGNYVSWNGTSMAGPHVAGLVALMISANIELAGKVDVIERIIQETAVQKWRDDLNCDTITMQVPNNIHGYGRINALAAVEEAKKYISTSTKDGSEYELYVITPSHEEIELIWALDMEIAQLTLVSVEGKVIYQEKLNRPNSGRWVIANQSFSSGTYFIRAELRDGNTITRKVLVR